MVRLLPSIGIIAALVVVVVMATRWFIKHQRTKVLDRKQSELACYAPAVLRGDPLVKVVIDQGRQLAAAGQLLRNLLTDDAYVVLSQTHTTAIEQWLATQTERDNPDYED